MYSRRLKKSLSDLKIKDLSMLNVQGRLAAEEVSIYIQIIENKEIEGEGFRSKMIKKGSPKKKVT
jgi:hypothetical protein